MTDDLKAKTDAAWQRAADFFGGKSTERISNAMEASIAAALAPVLERVARLEADNSHDAPDPEWERRWDPKPPPTPCATCGGARWVCDVSVDGASYHRKPCPDCSKPAAGPEGETACTRHGQYRCPACAAGMVEEAQPPSPAESEGSVWRVGRKLGRTLYIGDKCVGMVDTPELAAAIVEAMNAPSRAEDKPGETGAISPAATQDIPQNGRQAPDCKHWTSMPAGHAVCVTVGAVDYRCPECALEAKLASAERRIAELEKNQDAFAEGAFANGRAEGRAAGIREAAYIPQKWQLAGVVSMSPGEAAREILALLDKKPEVGT